MTTKSVRIRIVLPLLFFRWVDGVKFFFLFWVQLPAYGAPMVLQLRQGLPRGRGQEPVACLSIVYWGVQRKKIIPARSVSSGDGIQQAEGITPSASIQAFLR